MTRAYTTSNHDASLGRNPIDAAKQAYAYRCGARAAGARLMRPGRQNADVPTDTSPTYMHAFCPCMCSSSPGFGTSPNSVSDWRAFDHDICDDWAPPRPTQVSHSTFAAPNQPGGARPKLQLLPRSKPLPGEPMHCSGAVALFVAGHYMLVCLCLRHIREIGLVAWDVHRNGKRHHQSMATPCQCPHNVCALARCLLQMRLHPRTAAAGAAHPSSAMPAPGRRC